MCQQRAYAVAGVAARRQWHGLVYCNHCSIPVFERRFFSLLSLVRSRY